MRFFNSATEPVARFSVFEVEAYGVSGATSPTPTPQPTTAPSPAGTSALYPDLKAVLPGQEFDVTGLAAGEYYMVIHIDPAAAYLESTRANNTAWSRIFMDPRSGRVAQRATSP